MYAAVGYSSIIIFFLSIAFMLYYWTTLQHPYSLHYGSLSSLETILRQYHNTSIDNIMRIEHVESVFSTKQLQRVWVRRMRQRRFGTKPHPDIDIINVITWSYTLASTAQYIVQQCDNTASIMPAATYYTTHNVYNTTTAYVISEWFNQRDYYDYYNNKPTVANAEIDDYLQMIYANVSEIGCGQYNCTVNNNTESRWLCLYDKQYDYKHQPYIAIPDEEYVGDDVHPAKNDLLLGITQQQIIIETINNVRSDVQPTASNMLGLIYDNILSYIAIAYIKQCDITTELKHVHDSNKVYGVTVAKLPHNNIKQAIQQWYNTTVSYNYASNTGYELSHQYLQLVNANSQYVGCAYNICQNDHNQKEHLYVCVYDKLYNPHKQPYISGDSCNSQHNTCAEYYGDKAVCKNKLCYYAI